MFEAAVWWWLLLEDNTSLFTDLSLYKNMLLYLSLHKSLILLCVIK